MNRLFKFVSISTTFMNTVICLPIFQTYLTFMICKSDNPIYGSLTCYQGEYFIHFFVAIFGFLIHFFSNIIFGLFYREFNPFHQSTISGPFERSFMLRQGLKILLPFYTLVSFSRNWKTAGVILYGIYMLGLLILRYRQNPFYTRWWFGCIVGSEGLVFWAIICQLIHLAVDTSDQGKVGSVFFLISSPIVVFGIIRIIESRSKKIKFQSIKSLPRDVDVELYINILLNLIRNRRKQNSLIELEGFVKYHTKICTNLTCPCTRLVNPQEPNFEPKKETWYLWLESLLKEGIDKFPKSATLHIFSAFLFYEKLHNKFKALYEMETVSSLKHSVEQACVTFRLKETIEHHMIHDDQKFVETSGLDFKQAYIFYQKFLLFEHLIGETTSLQVNFWIELLEKNPKPQILETKGIQIVTLWEKIAKVYQKLIEMNSNHIPTLRLYGDFLKDVANDPTESTKVIDKIENAATTTNIRQQLNETDEHQDFEEYQKSFITLYGDSKRLGLVKDITPEITKILGYTRSDLVDQTLNNVCPKIFEDFQERLFSTIMERPDLNVLNSNTTAFFMNKEGYLVFCSLLVYLVPDLKDGLVFLFFFRKIEDDEEPFAKYKLPYHPGNPHYIIYNTQTELIYGYTKNCWTSFGIPSHLIENVGTEGEFLISDIFPDFHSIDQEQLKGTKGVTSVIDTTNLDQKFILKRNNNSSYASSSENTEDQINNRRRVPVFLSGVEEPFICGPNIQYLRVIEQEIEDIDSPNRVVQQDNYINNNDRNPDIEGGSKFDLEQSMNSDAPLGSNIFSLDSLNEDVKLMTEFRNLMAKKTMTKSTKRLLIGIINFFLILIGMESYEYNMVTEQVQEVKSGFNDISLAYARFTTIAEINFFMRELQFLAKYPSSPDAIIYIPAIRTYSAQQIAYLQNVQYELTAAILALQNMNFVSLEGRDFTFVDSQDGVNSTERLHYMDGFFKYVTSLTRIRNASLASLVSKQNPLDSILDDVEMVRRNGYGPLRAGAEKTIYNFNNYHSDRLDNYGRKYLIALIILLVILIGAVSTITLLIFSIEGKKCFILSLFGYIPMEELEELLQKCQDFAEKYLEGVSSYEHEKSLLSNGDNKNSISASKSHQSLHDMTFKADRSYHSNNGEDSSMFNMSENIKVAPVAQFQLTPREMNYSAVRSNNHEDLESRSNSVQTVGPITLRLPQDQNFLSTSSYMLGSETKRPLQQTLRDENTTERTKITSAKPKVTDKFNLIQELGDERAQQLFRVKKAERSSFTKYTFSGLVFWSGIFVVQYFMVERWFISKTTVIYHHLNLNFGRMAYLKYVTAFYFEEISEVDTDLVYSYPGITKVVNRRLIYEEYVQNINKEIAYSTQAGLPKVFNDYLDLFQEVNYNDLCPLLYDGSDIQTCQQDTALKIQNGLSLSIISDLTNIDSALKDFQNDVAAITTTNATERAIEIANAQWKALISSAASQITQTIYSLSPVLALLNDAYTEAFGKFISFAGRTIKAIYASFVGFCVILTFCWILYVMDVDKRLRRTRSVLNMIPVETMATNENLKSAVLSENFQTILKQ